MENQPRSTKQIIPGALTEMPGLTTKARRPTTGTQPDFLKSERQKGAQLFPQFDLLNDPVLARMVDDAAQFAAEFRANPESSPRWLSCLGGSGTGKTFLAGMLWNYAHATHELRTHHSLLCGVVKVFWPKLLSQLREQKYWLVEDLADS